MFLDSIFLNILPCTDNISHYFSLDFQAAHNHMNLGALYHLTGRLEKAEASYLEALRLSPGDKLTITNIKKLRSIRNQEHL